MPGAATPTCLVVYFVLVDSGAYLRDESSRRLFSPCYEYRVVCNGYKAMISQANAFAGENSAVLHFRTVDAARAISQHAVEVSVSPFPAVVVGVLATIV